MSKAARMKKGYAKLKIGMSLDEVINIFGLPDSEGIRNGVLLLGWHNQEWKGMLRGGMVTRSVEIEVHGGHVISYNGHNINMSAY